MIATRINPTDDLAYLLGSIDSTGRNRKSEIVGGGLLAAVIEARKMAGKFKEPSFVYTYREPKPLKEIGGAEFEEKLKEEILETFLPKLDRTQFYYFFIRHHNLDRSYELNFYLVCMANGRQFSPYFDKRYRKAHEFMGKMIHQENPHLTNPNAPENAKLLVTNPRINESAKVLFNDVSTIAEKCVKSGKVHNRSELISVLEKNGYSIPRCGEDYFTVSHGNTRVRLSGAAADSNFEIESFKKKCSESLNPTVNYRELWLAENERRHEIFKKKYKHLKKDTNYEDRKPTNQHEQMDRTAFAPNPTEHTNGGKTRIVSDGGKSTDAKDTIGNRTFCGRRSSEPIYGRYKARGLKTCGRIDFGDIEFLRWDPTICRDVQPEYTYSQQTLNSVGSGDNSTKTKIRCVGEVVDDFVRLFVTSGHINFNRLLLDLVSDICNFANSKKDTKPPVRTNSIVQKDVLATTRLISENVRLSDPMAMVTMQNIALYCVSSKVDPEKILKALDTTNSQKFCESWERYYREGAKFER